MARTPSNMLELGTVAPDFTLPDTNFGGEKNIIKSKGEKGTLVFFICNHCPFVHHVNEELVKMANDFQKQGIQFIAISSNDVENYPDDAPEKMTEVAKNLNYPFPYLYDETQEVAKSYDAACTPDFYLFDSELKLVYRGQMDSSRPGNEIPVTGEDLRNAMQNLIDNKPQSEVQKPSLGCNIKWKQ
ncbi:MAG: thioredoxin family protein [Flavobacteriales bacterium]|nr:thioredoxin family protein [Flavobacteriales bacterium]